MGSTRAVEGSQSLYTHDWSHWIRGQQLFEAESYLKGTESFDTIFLVKLGFYIHIYIIYFFIALFRHVFIYFVGPYLAPPLSCAC